MNYNREKLWGNELINRFLNVKKTLADTALDAGRDLNDINLLAVSKRHSGSSVKVLIDAGHRLFGENQVQEALSKFPKIIDQTPDLSLHMIGSLQTNKVREAVAIFDVIETLDRSRLAKALAKERDKSGNYNSKGERVEWWSSTDNNGQPWARKLHNDNVDLEKIGNTKNSGKYIRCLKD